MADAAAADSTVIVVDDDASVRRSVSRLIRSAGFSVKTFESPKAFLRAPLPTGPACVLLDMNMEGMTGMEVHDVLRRNEHQVPVVFLSGYGTVPIAVTSLRRGAEDFSRSRSGRRSCSRPYTGRSSMTVPTAPTAWAEQSCIGGSSV